MTFAERDGDTAVGTRSVTADATSAETSAPLPTLGAVGSWVSPHADDRLKTTEHRFAPGDLDQFELPKLASRPMSMGEITAAHTVVAAAAPEPTASLADPPVATAAPMAPIGSADPASPADPVAALPPPLPSHAMSPTPMGIPRFDTLIDTPPADWSVVEHHSAADDIWAMVDELLGPQEGST